MKRVFLSLIVTGILLLSACGVPSTAPPAITSPLDYEIIREGETSPGRALIEILVSIDATKEEAMVLADYLVDKYQQSQYNFMYIDIFDSLECAHRFDTVDYPLSEEQKHHLVAIIINKSQDYVDIEWTAIKRP